MYATCIIAAARRRNPTAEEKNENEVAVGKNRVVTARGVVGFWTRFDPVTKNGVKEKYSDNIGHGAHCCSTRARHGFKPVSRRVQRLRHTCFVCVCMPYKLIIYLIIICIIRSDCSSGGDIDVVSSCTCILKCYNLIKYKVCVCVCVCCTYYFLLCAWRGGRGTHSHCTARVEPIVVDNDQ